MGEEAVALRTRRRIGIEVHPEERVAAAYRARKMARCLAQEAIDAVEDPQREVVECVDQREHARAELRYLVGEYVGEAVPVRPHVPGLLAVQWVAPAGELGAQLEVAALRAARGTSL